MIPILFDKKEDCCACGACLNICHRHAISLEEDECGFLYPKINEDLCTNCGACKRVCAFQNVNENNSPIECYAAVNRNKDQVKLSASGGVFSALATKIIKENGVVFGAAFDDNWTVKHLAANNISQLYGLLGSKYVQSDTGKTFSEVKEYLNSGKKVLYSGSPCQIAGLKSFLGKEYNNLLTIDIVCHGVPSNKMFKDYISVLEKKYGGRINSFVFRDKSLGWGKNGSIVIDGKRIKIWESASSYIYYFTKSSIHRKNCYKCKFAGSHRPADLTIGDFWGVENQHPNLLNDDGWNIKEGISLVIANTVKGVNEIKSCVNYIQLEPSDFKRIASGNDQLKQPSMSDNREVILERYRHGGWNEVDAKFLHDMGLNRYRTQIGSILPSNIKSVLKSLIK